MRQPRLLAPLLTAGLLGSLVLGWSLPVVTAGSGPTQLAQGGLPEAAIQGRPADAGKGSLEPLHTYYQVLSELKDRYYGPMPGDAPLTYAAIRGMLRSLDDPYTRFLDPAAYRRLLDENHGGYMGIGAVVAPNRTRDGYPQIHRILHGTLAEKAGLKPLDVIMMVNGVSTHDKSFDAVRVMLNDGHPGTPVRLTIRRHGVARPRVVRLQRQLVEFEIVESRMLEGKVGMIAMSEFNELSDAQIDRALTRLEQQGMRALILDLRGNRGGTLDAAQEIASRFLPGGRTVVTIVEKGGDPEVRKVIEEKHNHRFNQPGRTLPLVVLVNRSSASAAEIVSGAIKDHHAGIIMGTTTYGKGLVQTVVPLRGGAALAVTSAHYRTPNGADINRSPNRRGGITPDVLVEATEEDWVHHNDVQLKKALDLLHQRIGYRRPAGSRAQVSRRPGVRRPT